MNFQFGEFMDKVEIGISRPTDFFFDNFRHYAVSRLYDAASPEQVLLYLPQLVQALKYESQQSNDLAQV